MAYGKIKTGKGDGRIKVDPREKEGFNPEPKPGAGNGGGRVYTGGTPDFNERTGLYRPGSPNENLNPISGKKPGRKTIMPVPKPGDRRARKQPMPLGVRPGGPIVDRGRPAPGNLIRRKKPSPIGKKPGRKTIQPVPRRTISSMGRKQPIARNGGGR